MQMHKCLQRSSWPRFSPEHRVSLPIWSAPQDPTLAQSTCLSHQPLLLLNRSWPFAEATSLSCSRLFWWLDSLISVVGIYLSSLSFSLRNSTIWEEGVFSPGSVNIAQDTEIVEFRYPTTLDLNFAMSIIAVWPWDSLTLSMDGWSFELFHFLAALTAFLWIFWTPTPLFS